MTLDPDYSDHLQTHIQHLLRCNEMLMELTMPLIQKFPKVQSVQRLAYITQNVGEATVEILTDMQQLSMASMELYGWVQSVMNSSGSSTPVQPL